MLDDISGYITEGLAGMNALIMDGKLLAVLLQAAVELPIMEMVPSMRGASATSRTKPAKLSTGVEVQVPEYLEQGEVIRISTVTGRYVSREPRGQSKNSSVIALIQTNADEFLL